MLIRRSSSPPGPPEPWPGRSAPSPESSAGPAAPPRARADGRSAPSTPHSSGSQSMIESGGTPLSSPSRLQQEVEADPRHPEHEQGRVVAHEAALHGAHGSRPGPDDSRGPAHQRLLDEPGLDRVLRESAGRKRRTDDEGVDQLIEVPLVREQLV